MLGTNRVVYLMAYSSTSWTLSAAIRVPTGITDYKQHVNLLLMNTSLI